MEYIATLKLLIIASVFLSVLALALRAHAADVLYLFRNWRLGLRAFAAIYVIVPIVAALIVANVDLKHEVKVAILILSVSPIPPLLPKRQLKSGADSAYITGLLVGAALVSPIASPLGLELLGRAFGVDPQISFGRLAMTLAITILLPLLSGLALQRVLRSHAEKVADVLAKAAGLLLVGCALVLLVLLLPAIRHLLGGGTLLAIVGIIIAGLLAGNLAGGASPRNRTALSLAAATRHPGVAMGIATTNFPDEKAVLVAILLYVVVGVLVAIPVLRLNSRITEH
jgi:BASS family bile acid:Na+ symporter